MKFESVSVPQKFMTIYYGGRINAFLQRVNLGDKRITMFRVIIIGVCLLSIHQHQHQHQGINFVSI